MDVDYFETYKFTNESCDVIVHISTYDSDFNPFSVPCRN